MASNFSSLRSSRKNLLDKLSQAIKQETTRAGQDERFWKLTIDQKTGLGFAKLRLLPAPKNEELPWVRVYQHAFKGPTGAWLIENCPTTLGGQHTCPICKNNSELWNTNDKEQRKIASERKRKLNYISNVLILDDSSHPENVGKVFLFKYGKKIHEKVTDIIEPQFPDQKPADPFDLFEGCDFKLKSQKKDGFINYDKSEFSDPSELFAGDEKKQEATWESEFPLTPFAEDKQFKSYDELEKRFTAVMTGARGDAPKTADEAIKAGNKVNDEEVSSLAESLAKADASDDKPKPRRAPTKKDVAPVVSAPEAEDVPDDEQELKDFFAGVIGETR